METAGSATVETDAESASGFVGSEIRRLRKARKITLTELGSQTGLSVGYLSQIERNLSSPTVKALFDISHALGVSINWFFHESSRGSHQEEAYIVRAGRHRSIRFDAGVVDQLLNTKAVSTLEFLRCSFEPGAAPEMEPYSHEGEECGIIVAGELELTIDGVTHRLQAGDSFSFPSTMQHAYRNPGDVLTEVIWCVSPPSY